MRIKLIIGYNSDSLGPVLCSLNQFAADLFQVNAACVIQSGKGFEATLSTSLENTNSIASLLETLRTNARVL